MDLTSGFRSSEFAAVVFNPPYLPVDDAAQWDDWFELAVSGGDTGRTVIERFLDDVGRILRKDGVVYLLVSTYTGVSEFVEYAGELEDIAGMVTHDRISERNVIAMREKYEALIRESAERDVPYLIEASDLDCIESEDVREPYAELVGHERGFLVLVRPPVDDDGMRAVRRIVDSEQPAHAAGRAVELRPWIRVGGNSYLGINSVLSKRELVVERSSLGNDSVLDEREAYAQLGVKSRLDRDTFIS
jgi:hypothetical protein